MKLLIEIPEKMYHMINTGSYDYGDMNVIIKNGAPLTPDMLADLLMEERIRGELKQDVSYSKDIIDNVKCKLNVEIIDHRPCYCGAELREVWRK
jgi:hypothetical protein